MSLPNRDGDAGAFRGSGVAIEGMEAGIFWLIGFGGGEGLLVLEFMGVD